LNCNSNDLNACIGRVQLKRLPKIVAERRRLVALLAEQCRGLKAIAPVQGPKDTKPSYWFLFFKIDPRRLNVDKTTIVKALQAEGVPVGESYLHLFTQADWYKKRAVFGTSGLPWTAKAYKGDPDREYQTPNIIATDAAHFRMAFHERMGVKFIREVAVALAKVERAYLK
jgi:perosamine synthetase